LRKLGQKSTLEEVTAMVNEVDVNGNGHVDFAEFLTMMANKFTGDDLEHEADEAFRNLFDRDGDGFINPKELKHVMATLGEDLTDQEVAEMMIEADRDHDGLVSLAEFKAIISHEALNQRQRSTIFGHSLDIVRRAVRSVRTALLPTSALPRRCSDASASRAPYGVAATRTKRPWFRTMRFGSTTCGSGSENLLRPTPAPRQRALLPASPRARAPNSRRHAPSLATDSPQQSRRVGRHLLRPAQRLQSLRSTIAARCGSGAGARAPTGA
jgi:Ca2+-binding EF-hand superfamily protein